MRKKIISGLIVSILLTGCDNILEIDDPTDSLSAEQAFSSPEGIRAAATGLYTKNFLDNGMIYQVVDLYYSLLSDDLRARNNNLSQYFKSTYNPSTPYFLDFWQYPYKGIYQSNDLISRLEGSTLIPEKERNQYLGEALWFRAYYYLLLTNSYGDVPLVLTNNASESAVLPRAPKAEVDAQIVKDLEQAVVYLQESENAKTHITQDAAIALLARAYLYQEQWQKALETANRLIPGSDGGQGGDKYKLETIERVFRANSKEQILQDNMEGFVGTGTYAGYTRQAYLFIPYSSIVYYYLSDELVQDLQSESSDLRNTWVGKSENGSQVFYYPYKYKNNTTPANSDEYEYLSLLRLAELYLIRAEANAHLGKIVESVNDINIIRGRAGLEPISTDISQSDLYLRIETERRKEFFTELGHRWFDLRRTNRLDEVLGNNSYKQWEPHRKLFPVPEKELNKNANLTQNPGY